MKRKKVDRGDIISIPLKNRREQLAQVLWASSLFKNVILISFLKNNDLDNLEYISPPVFTSAKCVTSKRWNKLQTLECNHSPCPPLFIVGNELHEGDECRRKATESEFSNLLQMDVYGGGLVEMEAEEINT